MTHILIPRTPSLALLRPFIECPTPELDQAWAAMVRIAEVQHARDGQCLAQIEEPAGAAPAAVAGAVAAGWRLVPATPTREWIASVADGGYEDCDCASLIADILSRAPAAPALEAPAAPVPDWLRALEWAVGGYDRAGDGRSWCPRCGGCQTDYRDGEAGHKDGCELAAALAAAPQAPAAPSADERAAYVEFLAGKFPQTYSKEDAEHWWDHGHVSALTWKAARASMAAPAAPSIPQWIDDPHDIEQGQMLNPAWVKAQAASPAPVAPAATMFHDAGAIAQCTCGRYTLDRNSLSPRDDRRPVCECGTNHGWSGSFRKPGADSKWHGPAPAPEAAPAAPAVDALAPLADHAAFAVIDSMGWGLNDQDKDGMLKLLRAYEKRQGIAAQAKEGGDQ